MKALDLKKWVKIYSLVFVFALGAIFVVSDTRAKEIKDVDETFNLSLSKNIKILNSSYKSPNFLGDGEDYIVLALGKDEAGQLKKKVEDEGWGRMDKDLWEKYMGERYSLEYGLDLQNPEDLLHTYYKVIDSSPGGTMGNYDICVFDSQRGHVYYLDYDS